MRDRALAELLTAICEHWEALESSYAWEDWLAAAWARSAKLRARHAAHKGLTVMNLEDVVRTKTTEEARLLVLRMLLSAPGYQLHERVMRDVAADMGYHLSGDLFRSLVAWLGEMSLVSVRHIEGEILPGVVCRLLERGYDIATGAGTTPGVARARPEREIE